MKASQRIRRAALPAALAAVIQVRLTLGELPGG
jgi:hypothetical protein